MASSASTGWNELQTFSRSECPRIFYNMTIGKDDFALLITDLVAMWECSMKASAIIKSAKEQRTSIDPSESQSQLLVLLQKLQQGLRSNQNILFNDDNSEHHSVKLKTQVDLPRPLQPLIWTFVLQEQKAVELGEQLLRPCLFEASTNRKKLLSLQQVIREKDHVITRLLERLEASNTDLSLIFPGVKSKRGRVTSAEAERHIPGMAAFNKEKWSSNFDGDSPYASYELKGFDNLISGCQKCPKHTAQQHADWLDHLPTTAVTAAPTTSTSREVWSSNTRNNGNAAIPDVADLTDSDNEFERQPTPPHLKRNIQETMPASESSTTSSSDESIKIERSKNSRSLGKLKSGSQNDSTLKKDGRPAGSRETSNIRTDASDDDSTASETDDLDGASQGPTKKRHISRSPKPQNANREKSNVRRLGAIGRKPAEETVARPNSDEDSDIPSKASRAEKRNKTRRASPTTAQLDSVNDDTDSASNHSTPVKLPRRLGRLGKQGSPSRMKDNISQKPKAPTRFEEKRNKTKPSNEFDSDATQSPTPSPSPSPAPEQSDKNSKNSHKRPPMTKSVSTNHEPKIKQETSPEPSIAKEKNANTNANANADGDDNDNDSNSKDLIQRVTIEKPAQDHQLTAEELANQRREDLKRKVGTASTTSATAGVRKKRKF